MVVGDVMLDEYVWGKMNGVTSEAQSSQEFLELEQAHTFYLGGASNVVANIFALGGKPLFSGVTGNDENGQKIKDLFLELNIESAGIFTDKSRPTTLKERFIAISERDNELQILRRARESKSPINHETELKILNYTIENITKYKSIILSDYEKGVLAKEASDLCRKMINYANDNNIPVIVDPKTQYKKFDGAYLLKPNKDEILKMTGENNVEKGVEKIFNETSIKYIVVTLGKDGMTLFSREKKPFHVPAYGRKVIDVIGAGDTVTTIFGLGLQTGASLEDLTYLASIAAGIVVGKKGTATASQREIIELLENYDIKQKRVIK